MKKRPKKNLSEADAAKILGISISGVQQACTRGSLRRDAKGLIEPESVEAYKESRGKSKSNDSEWERRFEKARAELKEIELARARGELLDRAEVMRDLAGAFVACRDILLGLPSTLAPSLVGISDPEALRLRLDTALRDALRGIAEKADVA